ncbi:MAG: hypothetical protein AB8B77_08930 [Alphaproteobacteria bacterium]
MAISSSFYTPTVLGRQTGTTTSEATVVSLLKYSRSGGGTSATSGVQSLQNTLNQMDQLASRQRIMAGAIDRIRGVASGEIEPEADWEMTGGYLTQTGVPFKLEVDDAGAVIITPQSDLIATMPSSRQAKMTESLQRLDEVRALYDEEATRETLRDTLHYAMIRITEMENYAPARDDWELEFQSRKTMGRPMMVGLNSDGNLDVFDQQETNFNYIENLDDRTKLQVAMNDLLAIFTDLNSTPRQDDLTRVTTTNNQNDNRNEVLTGINSEGQAYKKTTDSSVVVGDTDTTTTTTVATATTYTNPDDVPDVKEDNDASDGKTTTIVVDPDTGNTIVTTTSISASSVSNPEDDGGEDAGDAFESETVTTVARTTDDENIQTTAITTAVTMTASQLSDLPEAEEDTDSRKTEISFDEDTGQYKMVVTTTELSTLPVKSEVASATELWQYTAIGKRSSGEDFFLDLDDAGEVVVRSNTSQIQTTSILPSYLQTDAETEFHVVPEYLRYAGNYDFYDASWEEEAMNLYAQKIPFYLDTAGAQPKVKELDFSSIMLEDILSSSRADQLLQARISLLI